MPAPMPMPAPTPATAGLGGGGLLGSVASQVGSTLGGVGSAAESLGADAGLSSTAGSSVGTSLQAIQVEPEAGAQQANAGSFVLSTSDHRLRLERGTQMEFRVAGKTQSKTGANIQ